MQELYLAITHMSCIRNLSDVKHSAYSPGHLPFNPTITDNYKISAWPFFQSESMTVETSTAPSVPPTRLHTCANTQHGNARVREATGTRFLLRHPDMPPFADPLGPKAVLPNNARACAGDRNAGAEREQQASAVLSARCCCRCKTCEHQHWLTFTKHAQKTVSAIARLCRLSLHRYTAAAETTLRKAQKPLLAQMEAVPAPEPAMSLQHARRQRGVVHCRRSAPMAGLPKAH